MLCAYAYMKKMLLAIKKVILSILQLNRFMHQNAHYTQK